MNILFLVQLAAFISMAGVFSLSTALLLTPLNSVLAFGFLGLGLTNLIFSAFLLIPEIIIIKNNWSTFKTWTQAQENWVSENQAEPQYTGKWYAIFTEFTSFKKELIQKGLLYSKIGIINCFTTETKNNTSQSIKAEPIKEAQLEEIA